MTFKLTIDQIKKIEIIHRLFLSLEQEAEFSRGSSAESEPLVNFDPLLLEDLITKISELSQEDSLILKKLATTEKHLRPQMSLRHFSALLVPFERALQRNITDEDFLVLENDRSVRAETVPLYFVLENIRSAFNVGAFFRTAECLGVQKIFLTGYTPLPLQTKVEKTAMGTSQVQAWESMTSTASCIEILRERRVSVIAVETSATATPYTAPYPRSPTAFVFGNERFGLEQNILKLCDQVRSIPVFGLKNSLNVGIAGGIVGYEWRRQYDNP